MTVTLTNPGFSVRWIVFKRSFDLRAFYLKTFTFDIADDMVAKAMAKIEPDLERGQSTNENEETP